MVDTNFIIEGSSSEFDLNENDRLRETNIKIAPEEENENFWIGVTMTADNQLFELPVRGCSFTGQQNAPFDWLIDYGDGSPLVNASGTSSITGLITGHTYATAGDYIIKVIPNAEIVYGWARAFGCGASAVVAVNTRPFITNGGKFTWMSLAQSETSLGLMFNNSKYMDCINLTIPEDVSGWSISGEVGHNFNQNKYRGCSNLSVPEDTSGWSISGPQGAYFSSGKYYDCSELIKPEDTSGWSISGSQFNSFNQNKYRGCIKLIKPEDTSGWSISGSQGILFNQSKYNGCISLIEPEDTSGWSIWGSQEENFNTSKYKDCDILSSLEDWSSFGPLSTATTTAAYYLCYQMYYLTSANNTMTGDTTPMRSKFPNDVQDDPPYSLQTFRNRTGLSDYDGLNPNWK